MARHVGTLELIPLETYTDTSTDAPRFRVLEHKGDYPLVEPVQPGAVGQFQPDHRWDCPGHNAGKR